MACFESGQLKWELMNPFGIQLNCDLSKPLSPEDAKLFRRLYLEHSLLLAAGQNLTSEQQIRVMEYIGPVRISPETVHVVSNDLSKGDLGKGAIRFHNDLGGTSCPRIAGSLHAVDVVDGATSTLYANGVRGYQRLSPESKDRIKGLCVINENPLGNDDSKIAWGKDVSRDVTSAIHPLVGKHPETGMPALLISHLDTVRITGLPDEEMTAVANKLFESFYAEDNIVQHKWRNGDLVIYDNIALQHGRRDCADVGNRTLQRVVICKMLSTEMRDDRFYKPVAPAFEPYTGAD